MNIKFSIIMPVYNVVEFLEESINSVIKQTYRNLELIIVNDGSTDGSIKIAEKMSEFDSRISIVNQRNEGLSVARNVGLACASGDYVFFMDSDDTVKDDLFSIIYERICQINFPSVFMIGYENFHNKNTFPGKKLKSDRYSNVKIMHAILTSQLENYVWQFIIPKFVLETELSFAPGVLFEDIDWTARFLSHVPSVDYISDSLYCYRTRINSITHTRSHKKSSDLLIVLELLSKTISKRFPKELENFQVWRKPLDITVYYDYSLLGWKNLEDKGQLFSRVKSYDSRGLTFKQKVKLYLIKIKVVDLMGYAILLRRKL
ncbi:putative glycosyltransferase EpsJ [Leuconostoc suionicum]|uniref:Glycosyltransferase EpsJ n=1 Tax=Leuconostoc suionicum TaxID=1511761 RepID=A0A2N9K7V1_9LACO|nr:MULTISPECIES: glycosyltransferase [Leuconostoc]AHF19422.1 putative glycosyltransferase [Leuconostoc mesenteroides KFRI-MG]MCU4664498.1 glycosyltransferase [Leuconostoc mesenteroides]SPD91176.1 putative glycosyltransferase EpsJ [Leuconostoc suionicum]SPE06401.1 putative glycosyltransferase EpsJ [Leuconostoc suionicum]SPH02890.1 putative glycosyltransferase EpsJ [Leuconostoc suionicum]